MLIPCLGIMQFNLKKEKKIIKNYLFIVDTPVCLAGTPSNKTI